MFVPFHCVSEVHAVEVLNVMATMSTSNISRSPKTPRTGYLANTLGSTSVNATPVRAGSCNPDFRLGLSAQLACLGNRLERRYKLHTRLLGHSNCGIYPLATTLNPCPKNFFRGRSSTVVGLGFPGRRFSSAQSCTNAVQQWLENSTIILAVAALTWSFGSWPLLRRVWPAIAFLVFMFPLPQPVNELLALPLQSIATTSSTFLLQLTGMWVIQDGNVINLSTAHGMEKLDVALACNGLRMLMTMAATVIAAVIVIPLPHWKRIVLLAKHCARSSGQQHGPDCGHRVVLLPVRGSCCQAFGARLGWLYDDAAGTGTGWA